MNHKEKFIKVSEEYFKTIDVGKEFDMLKRQYKLMGEKYEQKFESGIDKDYIKYVRKIRKQKLNKILCT